LSRSPFIFFGQIIAPPQTHSYIREQGGEYEALEKDDRRWWWEEEESDLFTEEFTNTRK
jgi:hypothetical protein